MLDDVVNEIVSGVATVVSGVGNVVGVANSMAGSLENNVPNDSSDILIEEAELSNSLNYIGSAINSINNVDIALNCMTDDFLDVLDTVNREKINSIKTNVKKILDECNSYHIKLNKLKDDLIRNDPEFAIGFAAYELGVQINKVDDDPFNFGQNTDNGPMTAEELKNEVAYYTALKFQYGALVDVFGEYGGADYNVRLENLTGIAHDPPYSPEVFADSADEFYPYSTEEERKRLVAEYTRLFNMDFADWLIDKVGVDVFWEYFLSGSAVYSDVYIKNNFCINPNNDRIYTVEEYESTLYGEYSADERKAMVDEYKNNLYVDPDTNRVYTAEQFRDMLESSDVYYPDYVIEELVTSYEEALNNVFNAWLHGDADTERCGPNINDIRASMSDLYYDGFYGDYQAAESLRYNYLQQYTAAKFLEDHPLDANHYDCSNIDKNSEPYKYMTDEQIQYYFHYQAQYGQDIADQYLDSIKDSINHAKGYQLALQKVSNNEGNWIPDWLDTIGDGTVAGVKTWWDGVVNAFAADGVKESTQYEQMYYMQFLTNSAGMYLDEISEEVITSLKEKMKAEMLKADGSINYHYLLYHEYITQEQYNYLLVNGTKFDLDQFLQNLCAEEFNNNIMTENGINFKYASEVLSDEQYLILLQKNSADGRGIEIFGSKIGLDDTYGFGISLGNMLPSIAVSLAISLISRTAGITMATRAFLMKAGTVVAQLMMGLSVFGNSRNEALISGHDNSTAIKYAFVSSLSEVSLGMLLGKIPGLNPNVTFGLRSMLSEGFEEMLQEYISAGFQAAILNEPVNMDQVNEQALRSFVFGAMMSGVTSIGNLGVEAVFETVTLKLNGQKLQISSLSDAWDFLKLLNNSDVNYMKNKETGLFAFYVKEGKNVNLDVIKNVFPDSPIVMTDSNGNPISMTYHDKIYNFGPATVSSVIQNVNLYIECGTFPSDANITNSNYKGTISNSSGKVFVFQDTKQIDGEHYESIYWLTDANGNYIGYVKASEFGSDIINSTEVSYEIDKKYRDKGYENQIIALITNDILNNGILNGMQYTLDGVTYNANVDTIVLKGNVSEYAAEMNGYVKDSNGNYVIKSNPDYMISEDLVTDTGIVGVDPLHGVQLGELSFGGDIEITLSNPAPVFGVSSNGNGQQGGIVSGYVNAPNLDKINNTGFISATAGEYYSSLFEDTDSDIYVFKSSSDMSEFILKKGLFLSDGNTLGITKVDGMYELFDTLKSAYNEGSTDGTIILKIPEGTSIEDILVYDEQSQKYCIKPEYIDSFSKVDIAGNVSEPVFKSEGQGSATPGFSIAGDLIVDTPSNPTVEKPIYTMDDLSRLVSEFLGLDSLTPEQMSVFDEQVNRYHELSNQSFEPVVPKVDSDGKLVFEEGTIIHGIGRYDANTAASIANIGILSGQAFGVQEDGETFYCADFLRVPNEMTVDDYKDYNSASGDSYTPLGKSLSSQRKNIAFVISPDAQNSDLFNYDCYKEGTSESDTTKTFVNEAGLPLNSENGSSILFGVPSNVISGIIVGTDIANDADIINYLKSLYPNCYIADNQGNIIYNPSGETVTVVDSINSNEVLEDTEIDVFEEDIDFENEQVNMEDEIVESSEVYKLSEITDPALIEAGIKNGTITKAQVHQLFNSFVGETLSEWVLTEDSAYNLYINLLTACNNAGIQLSNVQRCIGILDSMSKYYEEARDGLQDKLETGKGFFNTYRTHGIVHAMDVLIQSINSYASFKNVGISNLSLESIMLSAVMHDTGMSGGKEIFFIVNEQGMLEAWIKDEASPDGGIYRKSHSFNSAVNIILEFKALKEANYSDIQIAEAAILTFAHSKSNSGLNSLSNNPAGWSFVIQALAAATKDCGFDIVDVLLKHGVIESTNTYLENFAVPNPSGVKSEDSNVIDKVGENADGKAHGKIEVYDFNLDWLKTFGYESLIVRIGDALTNNDTAGTNQYGTPITFETTNFNSQLSFSELMAKNGIDTSLPLEEQLKIMLERFGLDNKDPQKLSYLSLAEMEAANVTYEIDGNIPYEEKNGQVKIKSPEFVHGENNQTYRIEAVSESEVEVVVTVKNSEAVPFCTIFAIDERTGELISKGDQLFNETVDDKKIKIVIEIDSTTSETTKALYQFYADHAGIEVEIREVNKVAEITDASVLENCIATGKITKAQVQNVLFDVLDGNLNDWNISEDVAYELYSNLLKDCNKAGIQINDSSAKYDVQKLFMDQILNKLQNGEVLSESTYNAIFNSNMFAGDSNFAKQYLKDVLIDMGSPELANIVSQIYDGARTATSSKLMSNLHSYCDHTEAHVLQVAFLSMQSLNVVNQSISDGNTADGKYASAIDYKTMFVSGLVHDLGMAAGVFDDNGNPINPAINSYLTTDEKGNVVLKSEVITKDTNKVADVVRGNHTLNSALAVLQNRELFEKIGVDPDLVALLCFSHSKSNSGVVDLTSAADWSFSIEKIMNAVNKYNQSVGNNSEKAIVFDYSKFGTVDEARIETSGQKLIDKSVNSYQAQKFNFNDGLLAQLASYGLSLRVGDAYVNKAKVVLPEGKEVKWVYVDKNGNTHEYSSNMLVLTQSGVYMAYDPGATMYFDGVINTVDTESSLYGAFMYFKKNEDGTFSPWNYKDSESNPVKYEKNENDAYIVDSSNSECLMSTMGDSEVKIKRDDGKEDKYSILDNGYFMKDNKYYEITWPANSTDKPVVVEITETDVRYAFASSGQVILSTSGQFLAGESNVSYGFEAKKVIEKDGTYTYYIESKYYVGDITLFPYNTIDKGIVERIGEIATANGLSRSADIVIEQSQFEQYFSIVDGKIIAKTLDSGEINYGEIYIEHILSASAKNSKIVITINGYGILD